MQHRADDATGRPAPAPRGPDRINRHSSGLQEFTRALAGSEGLRILDLGPTSPTNIARLTGLGHKTYSEDILLASRDPVFNLGLTKEGQTIFDVEGFLKSNDLRLRPQPPVTADNAARASRRLRPSGRFRRHCPAARPPT